MSVKLGHFELLEQIGKGGMAAVFKAYDPSLNRTVAIKLLDEELARQDPQFVESFIHEAQTAAAINHQNIVQIYFVGEQNGNYYIAMELLEGRSLDELIKEEGPQSEETVLKIGVQISGALSAAYANQMVHGDIKPQNIFITNQGVAKLLDFGLAKMANIESATESDGSVWGSAYYISPERVGHKAEDFRSDIYSLGATLFHAMVGHPPFDADTPEELAQKRLSEKAPTLRRINPDITAKTEQIIARMLNKSIFLRYLNYDALTKDLRDAELKTDEKAPTASLPLQQQIAGTSALAAKARANTGHLPRATGSLQTSHPAPRAVPVAVPRPVPVGAPRAIPVAAPKNNRKILILSCSAVAVVIVIIVVILLLNKKQESNSPTIPAVPVAIETPASGIVPDSTGCVVLAAAGAKIEGSSPNYKKDLDHIGNWQKPEDFVEWNFTVAKAGKYTVEITYSCDPKSEGGEFNLQVGNNTLTGKIKSTGSWETFIAEPLGEITLESGNQTLEVKPKTDSPWITWALRSVVLKPASPGAAASDFVSVPFHYEDAAAKSVSLAGSFNNWQPEPMTQNGGAWTLRKNLKYMESYDYQFVVDGKSIPDPKRTRSKPDEHGGEMSVFTVSIRTYPE
jgi:tRNA A-37 threonylcarbamoyl transferase component Bud32